MLTTSFEESQDNFELINEDEALLGFITDYLSKRGFDDTVKELYKENNAIKLIPKDQVKNLIESVNQIRGNLNKNESVLFEWWKVFWNILKETKQKNVGEFSSALDNGITETSLKRSFSNDKHMKIIIEEGVVTSGVKVVNNTQVVNNTLNTNNSTNNTSFTNTSNISSSVKATEHPYKKLKKKAVPINANESMNTLDISSLTGIEKSLLATNLMNKDLSKLTADEGKRIETALASNKVSKESWEIYLRLCKEYQKMPQVLKNPKISKINANSDFISCNNSNYLGVIDQVNQPIDSRQLLLLRQSLYQEYLKKQSSASYSIYSGFSVGVNSSSAGNVNTNTNVRTSTSTSTNTSLYTSPILNTAAINSAYTSSNNLPNTNINTSTATTAANAPYYFDENIFEPFEIKEELNFNDFMNEYLI